MSLVLSPIVDTWKLQLQEIGLNFVILVKRKKIGTSLVSQWLGLQNSTARSAGSIPGQGNKIPYVTRHAPQKRKKDLQVISTYYLPDSAAQYSSWSL